MKQDTLHYDFTILRESLSIKYSIAHGRVQKGKKTEPLVIIETITGEIVEPRVFFQPLLNFVSNDDRTLPVHCTHPLLENNRIR